MDSSTKRYPILEAWCPGVTKLGFGITGPAAAACHMARSAIADDASVHGAFAIQIAASDQTAPAIAFGNTKELAEANARRLVACWNACAGIPTEELEPGDYEQHIIDTGTEIGRLTAQRDELLAALEAIVADQTPWGNLAASMAGTARAAIAKAKGATS